MLVLKETWGEIFVNSVLLVPFKSLKLLLKHKVHFKNTKSNKEASKL
jgi:hypothetical protein